MCFFFFVCLFHWRVLNDLRNTGGILTSGEHLVPNVCILNKYSAFEDLSHQMENI